MHGLDRRLKQPACSPDATFEDDCIFELKHQIGQMKQQLDWAVGEIWNLKMQMCELKQQPLFQEKSMRTPVLAVVCICVVIFVVVTKLW